VHLASAGAGLVAGAVGGHRLPISDLGTAKDKSSRREIDMGLLLWIIAAVLVIAGIVGLVRGQVLWGIALIVLGLLVGPGGVSIFT
jgi:hypothetical protein